MDFSKVTGEERETIRETTRFSPKRDDVGSADGILSREGREQRGAAGRNRDRNHTDCFIISYAEEEESLSRVWFLFIPLGVTGGISDEIG